MPWVRDARGRIMPTGHFLIEKKCLFCEKEFKSRPFQKRKFCSNRCSQRFNIKAGIFNHKGYAHTLEFRLKMSKKLKGRKLTEAWKANIGKGISGDKHWSWNGGRFINKDGYWHILKPDHPKCIKKTGYILEHRFVVEGAIGRPVERYEDVHHINSNKLDNRLENLMVFASRSAHKRFEGNGNVDESEIVFDGRKLGKGA